jgi:MFS family permease
VPSNSIPPIKVAGVIWGLGALLYLVGFFQRVAPAVITDELMRDLNLDATSLGNLSAFYFYSYVLMQVPTGLMADAWGPRRLMTGGALLAAVGTVIFALSPGMLWAGLGRLIIGGSVAVAFVGLLKIAATWFSPRHYGALTGMALFFGIMGAVFAGPPLRALVDHLNWRVVIVATAALTFLLGMGIWLYVRDHPSEKGYTISPDPEPRGGGRSGKEILSGVIDVFRYPNIALLFVIPGGIVGCVLTFSGLWGVPFLATRYGMTTATASAMNTGLLVAWAVGGPFFGWLSDRTGLRKPIYIIGCGAAVASWFVILFTDSLPLAFLTAVMLFSGLCSGCMIIGFAYAKESVPPHLTGTVSGLINMGVMMGPMILQPAVGWILDRNWQGLAVDGVRTYSLSAYRSGFTLMIAWAVLSFLLLFFTTETRRTRNFPS